MRGVMLGHFVTVGGGEYRGEHGVVRGHDASGVTVEIWGYVAPYVKATVCLPDSAVTYRVMHATEEKGRILDRWLRLRMMRDHWRSILGHYDRAVVEPSEQVLRTCERRSERLNELRQWLDRRWRESVRHMRGLSDMCVSIVPYAGGAHA